MPALIPKPALWHYEMPHNAAFYHVCTVCEDKNYLQRKKYNIFLEIITCDPSIDTMDHPDFIACSFMENSIGLKRVKVQ